MSILTSGKGSIEYLCHYGGKAGSLVPGAVPDDFTFNTPVGIRMDKCGHVWVCDTGNGRVIIFNQQLDTIIQVLHGRPCPMGPVHTERFMLPFKVCDHPFKNRMYITDAGNGCVDVFDYGDQNVCHAAYVKSFGYEGEDSKRLQVPNGITVVSDGAGQVSIWVIDEFYHEKRAGSKCLRIDDEAEPGVACSAGKYGSGRCVRFDEDGIYESSWSSVRLDNGKMHELVWPQGLSSDSEGNLYVANTGCYEILKCHPRRHRGGGHTFDQVDGRVLFHSLGDPSGSGKLNVMRCVSVVREHVLVPDRSLNTITIYDLDGALNACVSHKSSPRLSKKPDPTSVSNFLYSWLVNRVLWQPYDICGGDGDDTYFMTEPWINRVSKVRIKIDGKAKSSGADLIGAVGGRRGNAGPGGSDSQFNAVASAMGIRKGHKQAPIATSPDLPFYLKYNPVQRGFMAWSRIFTGAYQPLYNLFFKHVTAQVNEEIASRTYHADAGSWTMKAYSDAEGKGLAEVPNVLAGLGVPMGLCTPGSLAMAVYHPPTPLFGQMCPGTPILFVTNFLLSSVFMYQFSHRGELVNYGLPFGVPGKFSTGVLLGIWGIGGLSGPMGIAVNQQGEIFIADAMNGRISKWQILQTGQVLFRNTFKYYEHRRRQMAFTPTDVAVDSRNRIFVCDQYNSAIRLFDSGGEVLWTFGQEGYCDDPDEDWDKFWMPTSIAIDNDHLIVNDPVNRVLKVFKIDTKRNEDCLEYVAGKRCFGLKPEEGLLWCPFFIHAAEGRVYVPDSTRNVVNVYEYKS